MSPEIPSGRQQPNPVRAQDKRPVDVRPTSQQQSDRGHSESSGGDRFKKYLLWIVGLVILIAIISVVIDAATGKGQFTS